MLHFRGLANRVIQINFFWYILVISTPDIRNPGPPSITNTNKLSVFYQNVQGIIPFIYLGNYHPPLDNCNNGNDLILFAS